MGQVALRLWVSTARHNAGRRQETRATLDCFLRESADGNLLEIFFCRDRFQMSITRGLRANQFDVLQDSAEHDVHIWKITKEVAELASSNCPQKSLTPSIRYHCEQSVPSGNLRGLAAKFMRAHTRTP